MKIETLERYIKKTDIPYGDLLNRARRGGLVVEEVRGGNGQVIVRDGAGKMMELFFENSLVLEENRTNGLEYTVYNYPRT
jgi:hypothetical protein